jgi:hypothetical protein
MRLRSESKVTDSSAYIPLTAIYAATIIVKDEGDRFAKRSQSHVRLHSCVFRLASIDDGASSKKLQFSTLTAQDVVRISEFQVTHRDLYTTTDRAPVKDGVLDRRLVSLCMPLRALTM